MAKPEHADIHNCPRCGYDLGGEIMSWDDRYPLDGVCTECGLRFRWAELLNPALRSLPWLYEHAPLLGLRALIATYARALRPWSFWRTVRPHHKVVAKRLAMLLLAPWALFSFFLWIATTVAWIILEIFARRAPLARGGSTNSFVEIPIHAAIVPFGYQWEPKLSAFGKSIFGNFSDGPLFVVGIPITFTAFCTLIALCAPSFWRGARTRSCHILRIAAYSLTLPLLAYAVLAVLIAWERLGDNYGSWRAPEWWQRETWIPDTLLFIVVLPIYLSLIAWLTSCWWFGFRRSLDMRRRDATLLTAFCVVTGALGSVVYVAYLESL